MAKVVLAQFLSAYTVIDISDTLCEELERSYRKEYYINESEASFASAWKFGCVLLVNGREIYGNYSTRYLEMQFARSLVFARLEKDPITRAWKYHDAVNEFIEKTLKSWEENTWLHQQNTGF